MKVSFEISRERAKAQQGKDVPVMTGEKALVQVTRVQPNHAGIIRETQQAFKGKRRMYEAATTNRMTSDFGVSIASANAQILNSRIAAVARARTLERDNPYAWRALQLFQNNVGGDAPFKLEMKLGTTDASGKFTKDKEANDKVKAAWKKAGEIENATVRQDMTRDEAYWQAIVAFIRDGGVLWRSYTAFPNNDFKYAFEPIEVDRLDHWLNRPAVGTANEIQFGIERNRYRAPVAYHILTRHPGDVFAYSSQPRYRERVMAQDITFMQDIRTRAGQDVAMPRFSSVITGLHRLDQYDIAEMSAAITASCYAGFLVRKMQQGTEFQGDTQTEDGQKEINVEPNVLFELDSMQDFKAWNPTHPTEAYDPFTKQNIRRAAVGMGLSYFSLSEDFTGISYASGRMSLLENRREFKKLQSHFKANMVVPHFRKWLKYALLTGQIDLPMSRYDEICDAAEFIATRWEWVDPLKDGQANILNIEAGLDSRDRVIAESERGDSFEDVCVEQEADNDTAKAHKLDFSGDPLNPTIQKGPPGTEPPAAPEKNGGKQPPRGRRFRTKKFAQALLDAGEDDDKVDQVLLKFAGQRKNGNGHSATGYLLKAMEAFGRLRANDEQHNGEQ